MTDPTASWDIRRSRGDDLRAVLQLYDEAVAWLNARGITKQWGTTPVSQRPHLIAEIQGFLQFGAVAEREGVQGFIAVDFALPQDLLSSFGQEAITDAGYVHTLVARRSPMTRGVGAGLLVWAEHTVLTHGKTCLCLSCWAVNPRLIAYYESIGFMKCGVSLDGHNRSQLFRKQLARDN